jgi:hypothetical protein
MAKQKGGKPAPAAKKEKAHASRSKPPTKPTTATNKARDEFIVHFQGTETQVPFLCGLDHLSSPSHPSFRVASFGRAML